MRSSTILLGTIGLVIFVAVSCLVSEFQWAEKGEKADSLRQLIGLPSLAVGNLNPSARNPGLELLCTSLYDSPGGYCNYFTFGVSFVPFKIADNITVSDYP
jgi:hypothetical protein